MKKILNFCNRHPVLFCLIVSLMTAVASVLPAVIANQGMLALYHDFVDQQIGFAGLLHNAITARPLGEWTWNLDLGSSIINGLAFYNLASPFTWIGQIFDVLQFPYAIAWIYVLKYVVACLSAYWYLSLFVKKPVWAVTGAILYAFSGFSACNLMFYHFHDIIAFFPLMLVGLEKILKHENFLWFSGFVFLNAVTNYYFFVEECVFLILYFLFRSFGTPLRGFIRNTLRCLFSGCLGVGMAACILIPAVLFIKGGPRLLAIHNWGEIEPGGRLGLMYILYILRGWLFPADAFYKSAIPISNWFWSGFAYVPVISSSMAACYIWTHKRSWLSWLLLLLCVISFIPVASSWFLLGTDLNQRWWFMFILMVVLASMLVIEDKALAKVRIVWGAVWTLLTVGLFMVFKFSNDPGVEVLNPARLRMLMVWAVAGLLLFCFWNWMGQKPVLFLVAAMAFGAAQQVYSFALYSNGRDPEYAYAQYEVGTLLPVYDQSYRYATSNNLFTMAGEANGTGAFTSTIENGSRWYSRMLKNESPIYTDLPGVKGWQQLLGGKYKVYPIFAEPFPNVVDTIQVKDYVFQIEEQPAAPMVRYADGFVIQEDLYSLPYENIAYPLFNHVALVSDEQLTGSYPRLDVATVDLELTTDELSLQAAAQEVENFTRDNTGFSFETDKNEASLITTSIPYSRGWKATIDGEPAAILDGAGMIAMEVPAGNHTIRFVYHTPGFALGLACSGLSFIVFFILLILERRRHEKRTSGSEILQ